MGPMGRMRLMRVTHRSHESPKSHPFVTSSASQVTHMLIDPAPLLAPLLITDSLITDYFWIGGHGVRPYPASHRPAAPAPLRPDRDP
jgi:hypothetical protein